MIRIDPDTVSVPQMHGYLLSAVVPRPIAFASTIDNDGNVNLSPFSFFNCFGANPPILVFSPSRRGRDNTTKHTYENVLEVPEVSISIVNHSIVQQMSLSSTEYDRGINEFEKSGLTQVSSEKIKPPRVGESPVSFECKVVDVVPMGDQGGAGNLVICEVILMHVDEKVLNDKGLIDPFKLDAVARMGGNYYNRVIPASIFEITKPVQNKGIGVDNLPEDVRLSDVLTGNELAQLANVESIPEIPVDIMNEVGKTISRHTGSRHLAVSKYLKENKVMHAWACLLNEK